MSAPERKIDRNDQKARCPLCGRTCSRHSVKRREVRDLKSVHINVLPVLAQSCHYCPSCDKYFLNPAAKAEVQSNSCFTNRVKAKALELIRNEGISVDEVVRKMEQDYQVTIPRSTLYYWRKTLKYEDLVPAESAQEDALTAAPQRRRHRSQKPRYEDPEDDDRMSEEYIRKLAEDAADNDDGDVDSPSPSRRRDRSASDNDDAW